MLSNSQKLKVLFKNQFIIFKNQMSNIIIFTSIVLTMLLLDLLGFFIISSNSSLELKYILTNFFVVINSITLLIGGIYFLLNIFFSQITNGIHKLELKSGISIKFIYFSRIVFIATLFSILLVINIMLSLMFYIIFKSTNVNDILSYRLYISSMAWYAIWILIVTAFTILMIVLLNKESLIAILSSLFGAVLLVNIAITATLTSKANREGEMNISQINKMLFAEAYSYNLRSQIENSENLIELKENLEQLFIYNNADEFMAGFKVWDLEVEEVNEFENLSKNIETTFITYNNLEWDQILGFANHSQLFNENIKAIAKYGMENNIDSQYSDIYKFVYDNSDNQGYYKFLNQGYIPNTNSVENQELYALIKDNYEPAEYLFTRFLLENIYYSERHMITSDVTYLDPLKIIKNQRIKNILNPFYNVILMFHSIDYENQVLINMFGANNYIFSPTYNIYYDLTKQDENETAIVMSRDIAVEGMYIFYTAITFIIIFTSYIPFKKRIYAF